VSIESVKNKVSLFSEKLFGGYAFHIPVLCYHSGIIGSGYLSNDHMSLEQDLRTLAERGYELLPAKDLVAVLRSKQPSKKYQGKKLFCLTCDDGMDYDYVDYESAEFGSVPSFHTIVEASQSWLPQHIEGEKIVSFVIVSPDSREILDNTCSNGQSEWNDTWWSECISRGVMAVANHSWDHVHDTLDTVRQCDNKKGSFFEITTFDDAEGQIADAQVYIDEKVGHKSSPFFCYPYGHVSDYLREEYFPNHGARLGLEAAFSAAGASVTSDSNIWDIPRFVCGEHWRSPDEFVELLEAIEAGDR
jgi:peptidoglycan/xylan/chitin deacetylase (PgdA/CDA1 family)